MRPGVACALALALSCASIGSTHCCGEDSKITVEDCIQVRYIKGVWVNRQGTRLAYLVKSPNLPQNRNDYQLYVKDLRNMGNGLGRLIASGEDLSSIAWLGDGRRLSMLARTGGFKGIVLLNSDSGRRESVTQPEEITEYSMSDSGNSVAYIVQDTAPESPQQIKQREDRIANGYRIELQGSSSTANRGFSIHIRHRTAEGRWSPSERIAICDPFSHKRIDHFPPARLTRLSLSPNGLRLLFNYMTDIPSEWQQSPWVQFVMKAGNRKAPIMVLRDLESGKTSLPFKALDPDSTPQWSRDSGSFLVNAHSPVGSIWEQEDIRDHHIAGPDANMFWVNPDSGEIEEVYKRVPSHHDGALFWRDDGDVVIEGHGEEVLRLHRLNGLWREIERVDLPRTEKDRFSSLTSSGAAIVGVHETIDIPQNLFLYTPGKSSIEILTDLNPQLREKEFAPVRSIHWTTPEGSDVSGLLFLPSNYVPGQRYPLVIQTKGDQGWFTCDSGANHDPAFAPQPMASAGIMYLIRTVDEGFNYEDEQSKQPKGYPGHIGEAVQQMDIWNSAVQALSDRGLVDRDKVGIIGFSRTGWYVEYMVTHSPFRYAAATATDNTSYSLSEYWLSPGIEPDIEAMYDGPPYGRTIQNWLDYSISYNLEKIHTPLLLEEMGYGVRDDSPDSTPNDLAIAFEIFKGLNRLGKPVELYYYPDENHQPDHPKARLSTLQRNVDWYRFWLQGYEDPSPGKRGQYANWQHLRELQRADLRTSGGETVWRLRAGPNHP
jgi:dipeptidyl aminopeptidase/acylaminoacyl peptidase